MLATVTHQVRIAALALILSAIGALNSCGPYRVAYLEDSLRKATQEELIQKFGYPQRLKRVKNGDTVWEYDFQGRDTQCVSYAITFNAEEELRHWERRDCPR
jgi:hypothetical protein